MKLKFLFCCLFLTTNLLKSQSYLPGCNNQFYSLNTSTPQASSAGLINTTSTATLIFPPLTEGFAVGPAFGFTAPAPTFWSVSNDTLWYYNGSNFVKSGHRAGNANSHHIGGSSNFIYSLDASTGSVYAYNGFGNAVFFTSIASYTNGGLAEDVVGDLQDNFYILDLHAPQTLSLYNSTGSVICTYPLSGIPASTNVAESFAIVGNTVNVQRGNEYYVGMINGAAVSFTPTSHTLNPPLDFASCPVTNTFISQVTSNAGACLSSTLQLTANSNMSALSYSWSGPGIIGAVNAASVQVNLPGVYTCSLQSSGCNVYNSASSYTVYSVPNLSVSASSAGICSGASATLNVSGASSYSWQPVNLGGSSITVSPLSITVYTITGTNVNGCAATASIALSVTTTPVLNISASPSVICAGSTTTLYVSGASSYTWVTGSTLASSLILSPVASSVYAVSGANGICVSSTTIGVTVNQNPVLMISNSPGGICTGSSQTLSASGADSYSWNPGVLSGSFVNVSPPITTIYTVTGSNTLTGCQSTTTTALSVTVTPTLTVSAPTVICSGGSATFSVSGASTYSWSYGSFVSASITVSPVNTTSYTVLGYNGICSASKTLNLVVNALPTITSSASSPTLCSSRTVTLQAGGAVSYTWQPGSLSGQTVTVSPAITTVYSVTGTSAQNCTNTANISLTVFATPNLSLVSTATAVCYNDNFTVTSSGATSYSVVGHGPIPSSFQFGPAAPGGIKIVEIAGTTGPCTATASISVFTYSVPVISVTASPTIICKGETATLTAFGVVTYTWTNTTGLSGNTSTYTGVNSGTYVIAVGGTDANGCYGYFGKPIVTRSSPFVNITYSPAFSNTICSGSSATLIGNGTVSYTWEPGFITGGNIVVSPTSTSVYTLTGSDNFGCISNSAQGTVTVHQIPVLITSASTYSVCKYGYTTISVNGASGYTWSPGNLTGATVAISPIVPTVYTITGVNGINCTSTKTISAIVIDTPTVTITGGASTICAGKSHTLTASGADTYTWIPVNFVGPSFVVSPTVTSTYVSLGTNSLNCTASAVTTISVVNPPVINAISNPTIQCAGKIFTLSATGATSYSWSPANVTNATITVTPTTTTIYTVSGSNGVCSVTQTLNVQVNPVPVLTINNTNPVNVCFGDLVSITGSGASNYTWFPGNNTTGSISLAPQVNTNYTLSGSNAFNCKSSLLFSVNVVEPPAVTVSANRTLVCVGEEVSLTAAGAASYTWNGTTTGTSFVHLATNTIGTTYSIVGMDVYGCKSSLEYTIQVNECTGLREFKEADYFSLVYPNPNNGFFTLRLASYNGKKSVEIYDGLGHLILLKQISEYESLINLDNCPNGVYLLKIKDEGRLISNEKIIKY